MNIKLICYFCEKEVTGRYRKLISSANKEYVIQCITCERLAKRKNIYRKKGIYKYTGINGDVRKHLKKKED